MKATQSHIKNTIEVINSNIGEVCQKHKISVIGAFYNLDSGVVDFYEDYGTLYE